MKEMCLRARQLKTAVSAYGLSKGSSLTIVRGRVPGVGLKEQGAVSQCSGGAPSHHCSLAMFGNSEVFFVLLSLLSLCFVIIIKYSRAQKGTQASYPYHHPSLLL